MKFENSVIIITGGASGIGKLMGKIALEKGAKHLAIWDISEKNLSATLEELSRIGNVSGHIVDITDPVSIDRGYSEVKSSIGDVDLLINNAGVVTNNRTFAEQTDQDIFRTMNVNSIGPMLVTRKILPDMIKRDKGHICNIASAAGLLAVPKMSVYVASKWAAYGWSETMRIELDEIGSRVRVTTICPYFINTGMFDGIKPKVFKILDQDETAVKIIRAIEKDKLTRGIPFPVHFIRLQQALLPSKVFDFIFGRLFGIYDVMNHFKGRAK